MLGVFTGAGRVAPGRRRCSFKPMLANPFAPPNAAVADFRPDHDVRKPLSVWLTQAMAVLVVCGMAMFLVAIFASMRKYSAGIAGWHSGVFLRLAAFAGIIALALFTVVGAQLRVAATRWSALILMVLVIVADAVFAFFLADWLSGTSARFRMTTVDVAGVLALAASACLALALAWACCFSVRLRAWFS